MSAVAIGSAVGSAVTRSSEGCSSTGSSYQSLSTDYPFPSLHDGPVTPCPLSLPRLPPIPTLPPFSTFHWKNTTVRLSKTSPSIRSFSGFNPVNSPEAILAVLREQTPDSNQSQKSDDGVTKWVIPTVNVLYSFSATIGGVVGLVNIKIFHCDNVQSNIYLSGIPTSKHNFHGDWCSSPGPCSLRFPCTTYFDTLTLRRLKMPALAETSLSTFLAPSKDFSNGLRYTLALHRLRL